MKSPFPGMDPYLEHHALWPDVHNSLITAIRDVIAPAVAPTYYVGVESRGYIPRKAHLYAFGLRAPIPDFPLPLRPDDQEPTVPLNQVLHQLYDRARFDLRLDYSQPPLPSLSEANRERAKDRI